jgi:hypothetical protein
MPEEAVRNVGGRRKTGEELTAVDALDAGRKHFLNLDIETFVSSNQ